MNLKYIKTLIHLALLEDIGKGDITSQSIISPKKISKAKIMAKENGTIAGLQIAKMVFKTLDRRIRLKPLKKDGDDVKRNEVIAFVSGPARSILTAERTALNFLQRMSGIATLTKKYLKKVEGTKVKILDTRKTAPCLRILDKYAVKVGGGTNHRFGLFDAVLIKDNHIKVAGKIKEAIAQAKKNLPKDFLIEIEAKSLNDVKEALSSGADSILLDNMDIKTIKKSVAIIRRHKKKVFIEASGGINLKNIKKIANTGVDAISIGELTHSPRALDISLDII